MSMAAKSSDLANKMSGANLQMDGNVELLTQIAKDPQEPEDEDSSPPIHHLGLWPGGYCPFALIQNIVWRYK